MSSHNNQSTKKASKKKQSKNQKRQSKLPAIIHENQTNSFYAASGRSPQSHHNTPPLRLNLSEINNSDYPTMKVELLNEIKDFKVIESKAVTSTNQTTVQPKDSTTQPLNTKRVTNQQNRYSNSKTVSRNQSINQQTIASNDRDMSVPGGAQIGMQNLSVTMRRV